MFFPFELLVMIVSAVFFYRAGEWDNHTPGILSVIVSLALSLAIWQWLDWGALIMVLAQIGLFLAIGVVRALRRK